MNKKILAVAISSALAVPMAAHAIKASVSGHVNRAVVFNDDGAGSSVNHVDAASSGSRLRVKGSGDLGVGGIKVGALIEWGMGSNSSFGEPIKAAAVNSGVGGLRHSHLWFSGGWGKVTMGHGSAAADGSIYQDKGGAGLAGVVQGAESYGAGVAWRTGGGGLLGTTVGATTGGYDGGRYNMLRYDTPKLGPLGIAVSTSQNEVWEASATLNSKFAGASVVAKLGYAHNNASEVLATSGSIGFSQGTSITVSWSENDPSVGTTADNFYIKLAHKFGAGGVNSVGIDYQVTDDAAAAGDESTTWGIGFQHEIPGPKVSLYTGYRNWDLDRPGTATQDVDSFNVGARVRF